MSKANRKANKAKRYSHGCRNNGTCGVCVGNRTHVNAKREEAAAQRLAEPDPLDPDMCDGCDYCDPRPR